MNKKIIAIAITTVMAAPVAMADMKISGQVGAAFTSSDKNVAAGTDTTKASREMGDSGLSKLVFDGTSGNGYARVAMDVRNIMGGAPTGIRGRDFYLGYKIGAGSLQLGRMPSAVAGIEGDKYNATFLQLRRTAAIATTSNTLTDSYTASPVIQYATKVAGASVKVQFDPNDNTGTSGAEGYLAASVKGNAGAVGYFAGYNNGAGTEGTPANKDSNLKFGVSMKFGAVKATVMQMNADNDGVKNNATTVFADMGLGNGLSAGAAYGTNKAKGTFTRVALTKSLNKGTAIFGGMTMKKATSAATSGTTFGVGMKVKF